MNNPIGKTYTNTDLLRDLRSLQVEICFISANASQGHYDGKLYDVPGDLDHLPGIIDDIVGEVGV